MRATFMYAVCYQIDATCRTPLRSGGVQDEILRKEDGHIFLQGSSIAGALRAWIKQTKGDAVAEVLFGGLNHCGSLMISDGEFTEDTTPMQRPRLRLEGAGGTAAEGGKFNVAHIPPKSRFQFTVTWLGAELDEAQIAAIETAMGAMQEGEIRLGGQKSNGFGAVQLRVKKAVFDMKSDEDRRAWLENRMTGKEILLPRVRNQQRVIFQVDAKADRILVKDEGAFQEGQSSVTRNIRENGSPILPGSSVKGAILTRVRSIAAFLGVPEEVLEPALGRGAKAGDNGISGKICFEDAYFEGEKRQKITRIHIDKFTGGVMRGGLFSEEPASGRIQIKVTVPAEYEVVCGLLLYALRDLALGFYNLGSGFAIGRGFLQVNKITAEQEKRKLVLERSGKELSLDDPDGLAKAWLAAVEGARDEN